MSLIFLSGVLLWYWRSTLPHPNLGTVELGWYRKVVCGPDNFSVPSQGTNCQCIFLKGMHL